MRSGFPQVWDRFLENIIRRGEDDDGYLQRSGHMSVFQSADGAALRAERKRVLWFDTSAARADNSTNAACKSASLPRVMAWRILAAPGSGRQKLSVACEGFS